jgi:hypothetical protein
LDLRKEEANMVIPEQTQELEAKETCVELKRKLQKLTSRQVTVIDQMLAAVSPFGEVVLVIRGGLLHSATGIKSYDAFQWQRAG